MQPCPPESVCSLPGEVAARPASGAPEGAGPAWPRAGVLAVVLNPFRGPTSSLCGNRSLCWGCTLGHDPRGRKVSASGWGAHRKPLLSWPCCPHHLLFAGGWEAAGWGGVAALGCSQLSGFWVQLGPGVPQPAHAVLLPRAHRPRALQCRVAHDMDCGSCGPTG